MILTQKEVDVFIETSLDTLRSIDNNIHTLNCSRYDTPINFPIVIKNEDRDNIKILLNAMTEYLNNDILRKFAFLNFINGLKELQDKFREDK